MCDDKQLEAALAERDNLKDWLTAWKDSHAILQADLTRLRAALEMIAHDSASQEVIADWLQNAPNNMMWQQWLATQALNATRPPATKEGV